MKGATLKATMERLGLIASYSRPHVSDDNPYSESLFRTLKYRPEYPRRPFAGIEEARAWVRGFVAWYNHQHLHSGIGFVTPAERHAGRAEAILATRRAVYARAYLRNPDRWSGAPVGPGLAWRSEVRQETESMLESASRARLPEDKVHGIIEGAGERTSVRRPRRAVLHETINTL